MHLIKIDVVRLKPLQTGLAMLSNLVGGEPPSKRVWLGQILLPLDCPKYFRRENNCISAPTSLSEPAANDRLSVALLATPAIDVRRVEKINSELQGPVHDAEA